MMIDAKPVYIYQTAQKKVPFKDWLSELKDKKAKATITIRINRLALGNAGDWKSVGDDVFEMRIPVGPGYRLYYAFDGEELVLLLWAGDKSTQQKDINKAKMYWSDYRSRANETETRRCPI